MSTLAIESGRVISPEEELRPSIGVALLILGVNTLSQDFDLSTTPKIWTIKEKITKPKTEKRSGQLSIPAETSKFKDNNRERPEETTLAAITEFSNEDSILDKLYIAGHMRNAISVNGNPADIVILVYDGPLEDEHVPLDPNETRANGWVDPDYIRKMNGEVRTLTHDVLNNVSNAMMTHFVQNHLIRENRQSIRSVVGEEFSLIEFNQIRELTPDTPFN